jgi:RNA polymerase sigma-54 factor
MNKLSLKQSSTQRLSPQHLQTIRLLHITEENMPERIEKEIENNPALEKNDALADNLLEIQSNASSTNITDKYNYDYKAARKDMQELYNSIQDTEPGRASLYDILIEQLNHLGLNKKQYVIGNYIIASLENDGYLLRDIKLLINDIATSEYIYCTDDEVIHVLTLIQNFDPPGIAARNLNECLYIQLNRTLVDDTIKNIATKVLKKYFDLLMKNQISKIADSMGLEDQGDLRTAITLITHFNPKPYNSPPSDYNSRNLYPDFIVTQENGTLNVSLTNTRIPPLRVSKLYTSIVDNYTKNKMKDDILLKEAAEFAKQNLEKAQWFINAIQQRKITLLTIMKAIVDMQHDFFLTGNTRSLKPMTMKEIALKVNMDTSTISRVASNKFVKSDTGIYPLKYFFSTSISTNDGSEVSNKEVQLAIKHLINSEDKSKPYSDEELCALLNKQGYSIARRTVAKYREGLGIPTSRLRK